MKTIDIALFAANPEQYIADSQLEVIVVTRSGKPCAVLHGVSQDLEAAELAHSTEFWSMIEKRRQGSAIPWKDAQEQLK